MNHARQPVATTICLSQPGGYYFISLLDVKYFEAADNYTWVYTGRDPGRVITGHRLHQIETMLCGRFFCRIHRSFIVCLLHVQEMDNYKTSIKLDNGAWLPLGRRFRKQFLQQVAFCK